jgi:hypothetical protein
VTEIGTVGPATAAAARRPAMPSGSSDSAARTSAGIAVSMIVPARFSAARRLGA